MTNISSAYEAASILFNRQDPLTNRPLNFNSARKHVQKLCMEGAKVAVGIAGFAAVSYLMNQQASSMAAAGVCAAVLGGSLLLASRVSVFFHDAVKITTALVLFQKGFLNLIGYPVVASVKGLVARSITVPPPGDIPVSLVTKLFSAYFSPLCHFVLGGFSLALAVNLGKDGSSLVTQGKGFQPQKHLIDRGIIALTKPITYIVTRVLGYSASNHEVPKDAQ
ncbi:MAG TPA: hypothetical protein VHK67_06860 [Rhabdochlamydiaceae bacterium]|jgi:hypothetical protein|nr:hypothetical protein [Rhabdochlamydiaceae bacterium]